MAVGVVLLVVAVLVAAIWIVIEIQRMKHKLYAIVLISLVLFIYLTASFALKGQEFDLTTVSGVGKVIGVYFDFLLGSLGNLRTLTTHAVDMDWVVNETEIK